MGHTNAIKCPGCGARSLPRFDGSENAVACQNPECRRVFDRVGMQVGRWTQGYGAYEAMAVTE